ETTQAERLATGFLFTEGPLWHPDGFYYFVDIRRSNLHRITPGKPAELVRADTGEGNGTTFDLRGRLVICEGGHRRVTRWSADGRSEVLVDRYEGKRLNRPNDVVCKSDGSLWFTDPGLRVRDRGRWHLGLRGRRAARRDHPHAGDPGQSRLRRSRSGDALLHRAHVDLHAARDDAGPAAPVVPMKFGTFLLMQSPSARSSQEIYSRGVDVAQAAEALGFRSVWLAEHHFSTYGYLSRPVQLATYIAAKTTRLRVGTAVIVVP